MKNVLDLTGTSQQTFQIAATNVGSTETGTLVLSNGGAQVIGDNLGNNWSITPNPFTPILVGDPDYGYYTVGPVGILNGGGTQNDPVSGAFTTGASLVAYSGGTQWNQGGRGTPHVGGSTYNQSGDYYSTDTTVGYGGTARLVAGQGINADGSAGGGNIQVQASRSRSSVVLTVEISDPGSGYPLDGTFTDIAVNDYLAFYNYTTNDSFSARQVTISGGQLTQVILGGLGDTSYGNGGATVGDVYQFSMCYPGYPGVPVTYAEVTVTAVTNQVGGYIYFIDALGNYVINVDPSSDLTINALGDFNAETDGSMNFLAQTNMVFETGLAGSQIDFYTDNQIAMTIGNASTPVDVFVSSVTNSTTLLSGDGTSTLVLGAGGNQTTLQGSNQPTLNGGDVYVQGGSNGATGDGGTIHVLSGLGDNSNGGIEISTGGPLSPSPGSVLIGAFGTGVLSLTAANTMQVSIGGSAGTTGEVLGSDGSGNVVWTTPTTAPPTLTAGQVGFGSSLNVLTGSTNLTWNDSTSLLTLAGAATLQLGSTDTIHVDTSGNMAITATQSLYEYATGSIFLVPGTSGSYYIFEAAGDLNIAGTSGTSGQVLTSQGVGAFPTWTTPSSGGSPGGSSGEIQYNNSGAFGGLDWTWNGSTTYTIGTSSNPTIIGGAAASTTSAGRPFTIQAGPGGTTSGTGGELLLKGGVPSVNTGTGGQVLIQGGSFSDTGAGHPGDVNIYSGNTTYLSGNISIETPTPPGSGGIKPGYINIQQGEANGNNIYSGILISAGYNQSNLQAGGVLIESGGQGGSYPTGSSITINGASPTGYGDIQFTIGGTGSYILESDGALNINGSSGTTGQVLTSQGTGAFPTWAKPAPVYTLATLPTPVAGLMITVSDANSGAGALCYSDGVTWKDAGTHATVA